MKRERYSNEILFECNSCGEEFAIEGYYEPDGEGGTIIVPAENGETLCPNDYGYTVSFSRGKRIVPVHDVNWTGETR